MRTRLRLLQEWDQRLEERLVGVRKSRRATLAAFVVGVLLSGSILLMDAAQALQLPALSASTERRFRRWLANPGVSVEELWTPLALELLRARRGQRVLLTLDPTPRRGPGPTYVLGLVTHKRVLPLAWHVVADRREHNEPERVFVGRMCRRVAGWLSESEVTLVADKGLTGPDLIGLCQELGWHYVLRVSADPKQGPKLPDGGHLWGLVTGPGQRLYTRTQLFKRVGWIGVELSVYWQVGYKQPWILVSDQRAGYARVREYKRRWQAEPTYQDCKQRGWELNHSRVREPRRVERLLLVLFIVLWWAHQLGLQTIKHGQRKLFDRADRRDLSVVRLGRCLLFYLLDRGKLPPFPFRATATPAPPPYCETVR
jgi:hypothetical protein